MASQPTPKTARASTIEVRYMNGSAMMVLLVSTKTGMHGMP